jgi:hypothetical protein
MLLQLEFNLILAGSDLLLSSNVIVIQWMKLYRYVYMHNTWHKQLKYTKSENRVEAIVRYQSRSRKLIGCKRGTRWTWTWIFNIYVYYVSVADSALKEFNKIEICIVIFLWRLMTDDHVQCAQCTRTLRMAYILYACILVLVLYNYELSHLVLYTIPYTYI